MSLARRAAALAQLLSVPHGFTLSVAGTLTIAVHRHGYPGDLAVWCFVVGGGLGFCLVALAAGAHVRPDHGLRPQGVGVLNLAPAVVVPAAVLAGTWLHQPDVRMGVTGFVCVASYLVLLAAFARLGGTHDLAVDRGGAA